MINTEKTDTENRILEAAREVFLSKGMQGARMQEIADKARINKAMLHYYFRNKQQLFEAVFRSAFMQMAPRLNTMLNGDDTLFDKIRKFSDMYSRFLTRQPYLPGFIVSELNRDPGFLTALFQKGDFLNIEKFIHQVEDEMSLGRIKSIDPHQLFINIMALNIFPYIGAPLLKILINTGDDVFDRLLLERREAVSEFIIEAIKIEE